MAEGLVKFWRFEKRERVDFYGRVWYNILTVYSKKQLLTDIR